MDHIPEYSRTAIEHQNVSEFNHTCLGNGQCYRLLCRREAMVMLANQALQVGVQRRACKVKWQCVGIKD